MSLISSWAPINEKKKKKKKKTSNKSLIRFVISIVRGSFTASCKLYHKSIDARLGDLGNRLVCFDVLKK